MTGIYGVKRLRRIERELDELGFVLCEPKTGWNTSDMDVVAIQPKDNHSLPVYSRNAQIFVGTLEDLDIWMRGVEWARQYDELLRMSNTKKRQRKEQDERNRQLVKQLKNEAIERRDK